MHHRFYKPQEPIVNGTYDTSDNRFFGTKAGAVYRPLEAARTLTTPLMVIGVENDATTPTDHAVALYESARGPKELVMPRNTSHYAAYDRYWTQVTPRIVDWFDRHLVAANVLVRTSDGAVESSTWLNGGDLRIE